MASPDSSCAVRFVEIVEHDVHRAEVGGVGVEQDRLAGDGDGVLDARRLPGDLLRCAASLRCVRCTEAESGSCTLTSR